MRASEAVGRPVVSTSSATTLGRVTAVVVDPGTARVVALRLKKTSGDGDTLLWADIAAFGPDAVTVATDDVVREAVGGVAVLSDKHHKLLGKRVLSSRGDELGAVSDVEFDPADGVVRALVLDGREVPGPSLVGVGTYAVVVDA